MTITDVTTVAMTDLRRGGLARIAGFDPDLPPAVCRRLIDLGLTPDAEVECVCRAPLGSPTVYRIGDARLCLRRGLSDAVLVQVTG